MNENKFTPDAKQVEYEKKRDQAYETWHKNGRLGVTAEDHRLIGGTPPEELLQNPGKTYGEIWPLEKITEALNDMAGYLQRSRDQLEQVQEDYRKLNNVREAIKATKEALRLAIPYLKSINKLPPEFENFKVEDLADDPK